MSPISSLCLLLDRSAPSFCFYPRRLDDPARMTPELLERALVHADARELALQLIAGPEGVPAPLRVLLADRAYVCYAPAGAPLRPEDVPILEAAETGPPSIAPGEHAIAILRVGRGELDRWPELWRNLAERVARVVLVLSDLERWDEPELARYRAGLERAAAELEHAYLDGRLWQLSALSDRLVLDRPAECGAGIDHLTLDPAGQLHLCPGFALGGEPAVGELALLEADASIPNRELLSRERAPICKRCDAYQCRRCVHLNLRTTLEWNTPPWQLCRAAHAEREVTRRLLDRLRERGSFLELAPIAPVHYQDPFEELTGAAMRHPPRRSPPPAPAEPGPQTKEPAMPRTPVGRVTPEERDEIRALYLRKTALSELFISLARLDAASLDASPLYEKVVRDMGEASVRYQLWWDARATHYGWAGKEGGAWQIDFETREVFLS